MEKTNHWPLNMNALGFIFGMGFIAIAGDTPRAVGLGLAICLMWSTTQICETIKNR